MVGWSDKLGVLFEKSGQGRPLRRNGLGDEPEGASRTELKYTGRETTWGQDLGLECIALQET